uniref:Uncharacterized protein n=1 Tax=Tanacetum cinerariifolium TaxID=118510 RepID=A0A699IHH0_TANCI|nr:hypothetical protein [Tanacetum cinerariifolium]
MNSPPSYECEQSQMNSPPSYECEQSLDRDDSDLRLTPVLRPCNSHIRVETTSTTQNLVSSQNPNVDNFDGNSVRIIHSLACIVQAAKLRKQVDIRESGEESVMSIQ